DSLAADDEGSRARVRDAAIEMRPIPWEPAVQLEPHIERPQLLRSPVLAPVVECADGVLIGEASGGDRDVVVISDPDLIARHGLGRNATAILAVRALGLLRHGDETVVVDESLHGFATAATVWREMLRFPLVLVPVHLALIACLLLLATMTRFGSPAAPAEA